MCQTLYCVTHECVRDVVLCDTWMCERHGIVWHVVAQDDSIWHILSTNCIVSSRDTITTGDRKCQIDDRRCQSETLYRVKTLYRVNVSHSVAWMCHILSRECVTFNRVNASHSIAWMRHIASRECVTLHRVNASDTSHSSVYLDRR